MLNYFLLQLVGPQRKSLSLKDPEKYEFRPKQLLKQVGIKLLFKNSRMLIILCVLYVLEVEAERSDRIHLVDQLVNQHTLS